MKALKYRMFVMLKGDKMNVYLFQVSYGNCSGFDPHIFDIYTTLELATDSATKEITERFPNKGFTWIQTEREWCATIRQKYEDMVHYEIIEYELKGAEDIVRKLKQFEAFRQQSFKIPDSWFDEESD